jgi:hypothetical protein
VNEIREISIIENNEKMDAKIVKKWKERINTIFSIPIFNFMPGFSDGKLGAIGSIPIFSYPRLTKCIGLVPENPEIFIYNGYMQIGYDFDINQADENCLWKQPKKAGGSKKLSWKKIKWPIIN